MNDMDIMVVGVGGQGALLASNLLAEVGLQAGYDIKKAEVHGMSQRGGSVNSHVRWGNNIRSPVIGEGGVDILFSLEKLETLRYLKMLKRGGLVLIGGFRIPPLSVSSGNDHYPEDGEISRVVEQVTDDYLFIPTLKLAKNAGSTRAHNVVLLGALSVKIEAIPPDTWLNGIENLVPPKYIDLNRKAFHLGREAAQEGGSEPGE